MIRLLLLAQIALTYIDTGAVKVTASTNTIRDSVVTRFLPIPITRVVGDLSKNCNMFMFKDSSFVMRTWQKSDTNCVRKFNQIPVKYRKIAGYVQKRTDEVCLLGDWRSDSMCDEKTVMTLFQSFSTGWSLCTPTAIACGTTLPYDVSSPGTTVMDYDAKYKERYENGVCWLSNQQRYGMGDMFNYSECSWSGWKYPYKPFPGYWETATSWLFFVRKKS